MVQSVQHLDINLITYCLLPDAYYVLEGHTASTGEFLQQCFSLHGIDR
jgi:hypothetical protein